MSNHRNDKTDSILVGCAVLNVVAPGVPKSSREIADVCGISIALVEQIYNKALRRLRHPTKIKDLREYR